MIPVSVIIRTKNEALRLGVCLDSLQNHFAEVFVVDSNSQDGTIEIGKRKNVHWINFTWNGQYPKKSQWCLENLPISHDWILFVDADERMTPELISELTKLFSAPIPFAAFWISADPLWGDARLRHGQSNHKICLMQRGRAHFPVVDDLHTPMGEVEGHYQPIIRGAVGKLRARMIHDCNPTDQWFERHRRYAATTAQMPRLTPMAHEGGWRGFVKKLFYALPLGDVMIFLYGFVFRLGFLDGAAGLAYARARAWYYREVECLRNRRFS
jgi:glycosyltransferase involved in cell wall biosynthesis